jgi:hypothetical protein
MPERAPSPSDNPVPTWDLLGAIDAHGPSWPAAMDGWGVESVGEAISREILAGNLRDGATLTEQGRRWLVDAKARRRLPPA